VADTRLVGLLRRLRLGPASTPGQTDRDALRAFALHKDEAAFAGIVRRHGPMVLRVCRNVLHHTEDAEDACQATFLVLARRAETIANGEVLASWLHGVAYRTALRARRDLGRRRTHEREAPVPARPDPTEAVAWSDVQVLLEAEISRLPARYRAAFVLCFLEGRSRTEAAAELGLSENTLSSRIARARNRLKGRLARRGIHLSAVLAAIALTTGTSQSAMPGPFAEGISRAAMQFAARESVTGVSSFALQLTNGTLHTMTMSKITWAAGVLAVGGTLAVGTWVAGQGLGPPAGSASGPSSGGFNPRAEKPAAVDRTADYAQRQRSLKNLKAIALALHNYHDTNGRLPTDITDSAGKPLLSWRVAILPYIEGYDVLYKQFKLTEPWDSEHNLGLLAKMPEVLRVGFEPKGATHTCYQRFALAHLGAAPAAGEGGFGAAGGGSAPAGVGGPPMPGGPAGIGGPPAPGPGFGGPPGIGGPMGGGGVPGAAAGGMGAAPEPPTAGPRFPLHLHQIPDGTSNTIGVIEAGPPVPWSKPADFVYDPKQPLPKMTGPFANVCNVAMLDGVALSLRPDVDATIWRGLIDAVDGQVTPGVKTLRAQFPADSAEEKKALAKTLEENQALIAKLEEQFKEHAALLALTSKLAKDLERGQDEQARIQEMMERLRLLNKKLRDDLGLRPGAPVPGGRQ
jgi:RNA polymerase sigma factor (sigma-70 family)